jgi:SAM-dependent methyltransferase
MLFKPPPTSYERVPFPDDPYPSSHPDHLATVAILAGLKPPPVHACRVLELGCARGGNLIPMAAALPDARFLGIDSSPGQVERACALIRRLGLRNIRVEAQDILELDGSIGTFDYIICHGTFSWVPREVQEKILDLSARVLAPNGILYVSYNTYPGWHFRGLARELMCYHVRRLGRPEVIAKEARGILRFTAACAQGIEPVYGDLLKQELDYLTARSDSYLLHDHLEAVNDPVYFHDFVSRAQSQGLQFVSEVQGTLIPPESLAPEIANALRQLGTDDIDFEQYLDFVINRRFRQSVLCRAGVLRTAVASHEDLAGLHVTARKMADQDAAAAQDGPLLTRALGHLHQIWPLSVSVESLVQAVQTQTSGSVSERTADQMTSQAEDLNAGFTRCYRQKRVELRTLPPEFVVNPSEKPTASRLAREQATTSNTVTNLRHEAGQLNEFGREVVAMLDGSHDRSVMVARLAQGVEAGRISLKRSDPDVTPGPDGRLRTLHEAVEDALEDCLKKLARFALLIA